MVICCMNRRLNGFLEKNYGNALVMRNAGSNVSPLMGVIKQAVRNKGIRKITLITHSDCGAMKKVFSVLKENGKATEELGNELINQFAKAKFSDRNELEGENARIQLETLKNEFPELGINSRNVSMEELNVPKEEGEHKLLVISPGKPEYSKLFKSLGFDQFQCYVIQASLSNAMPDIELAANDLHASEVYFIVGENDNPRDVKRDSEMAALRLSSSGATVKKYDTRTVRKERTS